jgi:hypothetical protein
MTTLLDAEEFAQLETLATELLTRARVLVAGKTYAPPGATDEQRLLREELNAFQLSMTAVAKQSSLNEEATILALGTNLGIIMAQSIGDHVELLKIQREATRAGYNEVMAFSKPRGGVQ